jgi:uncharacterized membrane protein
MICCAVAFSSASELTRTRKENTVVHFLLEFLRSFYCHGAVAAVSAIVIFLYYAMALQLIRWTPADEISDNERVRARKIVNRIAIAVSILTIGAFVVTAVRAASAKTSQQDIDTYDIPQTQPY